MTAYRERVTATVGPVTFNNSGLMMDYVRSLIAGRDELADAQELSISLDRTIELKDGRLQGIWEVRLHALIHERTANTNDRS